MAAEHLILTASDRLARALREDRNLELRRTGARVWEAPPIQSLRQWLQDAWTASWPTEQLLHAAQELALWRDTVLNDEDGARLLAPLAAAREARRADQLVLRHGIDLDGLRLQRDDHIAFARWRRQLRARLRRREWLTAADLPAEVARGIETRRLRVPRSIELAGFVGEPSAAERRLWAALAAAGCTLGPLAVPPRRAQCVAQRHADAESQFRAIAADVRERLAAHADHQDVPPRLVLALPDPANRRDLVESVFRPVLAPWLQTLDGGARALPWRWEGGIPLGEQPQIAAALAVCELATERNPPALVSRVLLAAPLWTDDERALTAVADARLRDEAWPRPSLARVHAALPASLQARWNALERAIAGAPARALPSGWAGQFRTRLAALLWPGHVAADSVGFQALRDWERLLARLSSMDAQLGRTSAGEALSWLRELARNAAFEPRVEYTQPLLILAADEAVGLPCDVLYLADLSADGFPRRASPSPYLPLETQAAAGVPGADAAQALARARQLAAHLVTLADDVVLGHAAVDERGAEVYASPLFDHAALWRDHAAAGCGPDPSNPAPRFVSGLDRRVARGVATELPEADPVPAVGAVERASLRPRIELFRAWQESPFFAFCRVRLGIESLREPARGLDARRQGNAAHAVLQAVWTGLRDSDGLASAIADASLDTRIAAALAPALAREMPVADYGRSAVELERARLADVLAQWLRHEATRVDPFTVAVMEGETTARIGALLLRLRIDRVDCVRHPDGSPRWLVLDYKTGTRADPRGWSADKLAEPQLPLYASHAVLAELGVPQADGIGFAHLKDGHPALSAETRWRKNLREPELIDTRDDWERKLQVWREQLVSVALAFERGEAALSRKVSDRSFYADLLLLTGRDGDEGEA